MTIKLLDDSLINKIAAGEVIERPASIVKELVENSMDAGSRRISLAIQRGGHDLIEVEDDGQGIEPGEIELAFMRHATSKLRDDNDLYKIVTMGFRGEALPSIAAVSKIEFTTACRDGYGYRALIEAGSFLTVEPVPYPRGTCIRIKDVFHNTPARKKFMKSSSSESAAISDLITNLALARPDISVEYRHDRRLSFKTPGDGNLYNTMMALYGPDFCSHFIPLIYQSDNITIEAYIGRPDFKRHNRKSQHVFVNQRMVVSPLISRALDEAYRGHLLSREYPAAVLKINIPPEDVDVNIHPQKREVKFHDDSMIFRAIQGSVRSCLKSELEKSLLSESLYRGYVDDQRENLVSDGMVDMYPRNRESRVVQQRFEMSAVEAKADTKADTKADNNGSERKYHDFFEQARTLRTVSPNAAVDNKESARTEPVIDAASVSAEGHTEDCRREVLLHRIICQLNLQYIVIESPDGLLIVDQHAAHERIMFERLKLSVPEEMPAQDLLMPIGYNLGPLQHEMVMRNSERLASMGFNVEEIGDQSIVLRSLPVNLKNLDMKTMDDIIEIIENNREEEQRDKMLALMACKSAIKAGDPLTVQEMEAIIRELFMTENPFNCPHGRPTVVNISLQELDRRFKRTV